jgi:DNA polymerase
MGVDEAIADAPSSWFGEDPPFKIQDAPPPAIDGDAPRRPERKAPVVLSQAPPPNGQAAKPDEVMAARELARSAATLASLRALLETFDGCALKKTAKRLCLSRGSTDARIMLIGEAPGKDEDAQGVPFVGRAGQLLDRMLAAIGLGENDVYITNLVFWRPPGNRTPSPEEVQICQPFVERQIELLDPEILIFLGSAAAKQLTGAAEGIMKLRGKWMSYRPGPADGGSKPAIKAMATLHPAYLLRNPIAKRLAWRDLLLVRQALDGKGGLQAS